MPRAYIDGQFVELTEETLETVMSDNAEQAVAEHDMVQKLAAGISVATTIEQIRAAARAILTETGEGDL